MRVTRSAPFQAGSRSMKLLLTLQALTAGRPAAEASPAVVHAMPPPTLDAAQQNISRDMMP